MKLRQYAISQNWSIEDLMDRLEVRSRNTIYRYLRGEQIPNRVIMRRIFIISGGAVTPNDFYDLPDLQVAA